MTASSASCCRVTQATVELSCDGRSATSEIGTESEDPTGPTTMQLALTPP